MLREPQLAVRTIHDLTLPPDLRIPTKYFRLLLAADLNDIDNAQLVGFSRELLERGIVYFCAWGKDCERIHDCMDEVIVAKELASESCVTPVTTWHGDESLEEATEFLRDFTKPYDEYESDSYFWLALALKNEDWAATMRSVLQGR